MMSVSEEGQKLAAHMTGNRLMRRNHELAAQMLDLITGDRMLCVDVVITLIDVNILVAHQLHPDVIDPSELCARMAGR